MLLLSNKEGQFMKILSVDDSAIIRRIIRGAVDVLGYDFLEAANGEEALAVLDAEEVNLVVLDWNMPVLDGYQTLVAMRQNPKFSHIPVIMVTTESEKSNVIRAIQAGAQHYFTKPFSQEDLMTRILECTAV
jgi:two-component system, chemotaxis family, chemotaxis protein CheY